ncbi:MAG: glycogen debranching protein GlgX [Bacteroidetes bacterium]|nr:glycogen debranching protein GlgX [Bacteroidota bacterium]MCY4204418.1 glycogen debranching protein GlgX [Bacteroidota bacterium]
MDKTTVLGAFLDEYGANFSIFSANAERIELILLDEDHAITHTININGRAGDVWHEYVPGIRSGQRYAYRVYGPWAPDDGHRFNGAKLLLDPYARSISRMPVWDESLFGYDRSRDDRVLNPEDSASCAPIGVVTDTSSLRKSTSRVRIPWTDMVIYETHVKGLSIQNPDVPASLRGTYLGAASEAVLTHLKRLGVTTIQLLPIYTTVQDERLVCRGLSQYWGYNPLSYFVPDPRFSSGDPVLAAEEFKIMVEAMHNRGFEVILDVVYNHTGEGDHLGPTLSWRGIDNASYYVANPEQPRFLYNCTGCGNTLRAEHVFVRRLIMDSLRYWVEVMDVDGFRFDLTTTLLRENRKVNHQSGWLHMVQQDPVLSKVKLIAEPWDLGESGYQLGAYPSPWREWNDQYRDTVRRYWRGEVGITGEFATRIAGSSDIFSGKFRRPSSSINYVTSHDGFTLRDLVSYERKHNEANGENGMDGTNTNYSQNCGQEGDSGHPNILAKRDRLRRSMLTTLFVSQGVPMLLGGDELGRTQQGNNNPYCQDNEISWYHWGLSPTDEAHLEFLRELIAFRKAHPSLRRDRFLTGKAGKNGLPDAVWWHPEGRTMQSEDWAHTRAFGMWLAAPDMLLICFNPTEEPVQFQLSGEYVWTLGLGWEESTLEARSTGGSASVGPQSVLILRA